MVDNSRQQYLRYLNTHYPKDQYESDDSEVITSNTIGSLLNNIKLKYALLT